MAISLGLVKPDITIKDYPAYHSSAVRVYGGGTYYSLGTSTFQTYISNIGAVESTASRTADQYYTVLNVASGRGWLGTIVIGSPGTSSASRTLTIKTTIDGVVTERAVTTGQNNYDWIVIGPIGAQGFASTSYGDVQQGKNNYEWADADGGRDDIIKSVRGIYIVSVSTLIGQGLPLIRFKSSCKVEIKENQAGRADNFYKDHNLTYLVTG